MRTASRLALAAAALLLAPAAGSASEQLVDGIAAQVGTRVVLVSEVLRAIGPQEAMLREAGAPEQEIAKLRAEALEGLIEARLIEGIVAQLELYAKDEEVDGTIQGIAEENGLTLEQLYASVVFHGMTRDEYRLQIKRDLERRNVVNAFVGVDVKIEDDEIKALYEERFGDMPETSDQIHVRQILVSYGQTTRRDLRAACELVADARKRIVDDGDDFGEIARQISEVAPSQGGDIGWLPVDQLASWMSDALEGLEAGDVSQPQILPFGCSLLQLVERKNVQRLTFEQAQPMLYQEIWNTEMEEGYREWMEELRGRTYIDRRGHFADAAVFGQSTFGVEPAPTPSGP